MALRVLLCVSGGIAAYKAPEIVRGLVRAGAEVSVIMTAAAKAFVTEMSLATVSGRPVRTTLLDAGQEGSVGHIALADWADVVVVAPATADLLAKAASGLADDLASTCLLATRAPVLWAPAMNTNMWNHPATVANLATLRERGANFVGPDAGELACGWIGAGRMIEPEAIVRAAADLAQDGPSWRGTRVLVSAGPTRTYIDPVRFITNASSGVMGFALAGAAARLGADVTLVAGPVSLATPLGVHRIDVETADQMLEAMDGRLLEARHALVAMVAAVSDLAVRQVSATKRPKDELLASLGAGVFQQGVDVLTTLCERYADQSFFLGFGAQTVLGDDAKEVQAKLEALGVEKLRRKRCDALFVNRVAAPGVGFGSGTNAGALLVGTGTSGVRVLRSGPPMDKARLADWLLERLHPHVVDRGQREAGSA